MLDLNRKFKLGGNVFVVKDYAQMAFPDEDFSDPETLESLETALDMLEKTGRITWLDNVDPVTKKVEKVLKDQEKELTMEQQAETFDQYDQMAKEYALNQQRENRATYSQYELDFAHIAAAQEFQLFVNSLYLQSEIVFPATLRIFNLTDKDLNKINLRYKSKAIIDKTVNGANSIANGAVGAVDTVATDVIAPTAKIAVTTGVKVGTVVAKTGFRALGSLIHSIAKESKQCYNEIKTDPEVCRAVVDLNHGKTAIRRAVGNKINNGGTIPGRLS